MNHRQIIKDGTPNQNDTNKFPCSSSTEHFQMADITTLSIIKSKECGRKWTRTKRRRSRDNCSLLTPALPHLNDSFLWLDFQLKYWPFGTQHVSTHLETPRAEISAPSQSPGWKLKEVRADPPAIPEALNNLPEETRSDECFKILHQHPPKPISRVCSGFNICVACFFQALF